MGALDLHRCDPYARAPEQQQLQLELGCEWGRMKARGVLRSQGGGNGRPGWGGSCLADVVAPRLLQLHLTAARRLGEGDGSLQAPGLVHVRLDLQTGSRPRISHSGKGAQGEVLLLVQTAEVIIKTAGTTAGWSTFNVAAASQACISQCAVKQPLSNSIDRLYELTNRYSKACHPIARLVRYRKYIQ